MRSADLKGRDFQSRRKAPTGVLTALPIYESLAQSLVIPTRDTERSEVETGGICCELPAVISTPAPQTPSSSTPIPPPSPAFPAARYTRDASDTTPVKIPPNLCRKHSGKIVATSSAPAAHTRQTQQTSAAEIPLHLE